MAAAPQQLRISSTRHVFAPNRFPPSRCEEKQLYVLTVRITLTSPPRYPPLTLIHSSFSFLFFPLYLFLAVYLSASPQSAALLSTGPFLSSSFPCTHLLSLFSLAHPHSHSHPLLPFPPSVALLFLSVSFHPLSLLFFSHSPSLTPSQPSSHFLTLYLFLSSFFSTVSLFFIVCLAFSPSFLSFYSFSPSPSPSFSSSFLIIQSFFLSLFYRISFLSFSFFPYYAAVSTSLHNSVFLPLPPFLPPKPFLSSFFPQTLIFLPLLPSLLPSFPSACLSPFPFFSLLPFSSLPPSPSASISILYFFLYIL